MTSIDSLPSHITGQIIGFLDGKTQLNLRRVCKAFKEAIPFNQIPPIPPKEVVNRDFFNQLYIFVITAEVNTIATFFVCSGIFLSISIFEKLATMSAMQVLNTVLFSVSIPIAVISAFIFYDFIRKKLN